MKLLTAAFATIMCFAACGLGGDKQSGQAAVGFSADSAAAMVLAPGDVKITSTDGAVVLAVLGDSVRMQLSDSLRGSVKQELDSSGKDSKLASMILKSVGTVVNSALGFVVRVHVNDVNNLRYEDGSIRFDVKGSKINVTTNKQSGSDAKFSAEDAKKFIDRGEERQRASSTMAR
jgi:hypothetical protein